MEGICVEELYAHKLLVLSKMAISFNHKGVYQNTHGPFSPLPAEELPHFRVELPSHNQPHPPRVLPEQVSMIPCVITTLFKPFLHKGAELGKLSVYKKNRRVQQVNV